MRGRIQTRFLFTLLLSLILLPATVAVSPHLQGTEELEPGWSEAVSLTETFPQAFLPDIAADQAGNLYVVFNVRYEEGRGNRGEGIGFAMWDGETWSPAVDISTAMRHLPSIAVGSRGRLHLTAARLLYSCAWSQERPTYARARTRLLDISQGFPAYWNDILVDSQDTLHVVYSGEAPILERQIVDGQYAVNACLAGS